MEIHWNLLKPNEKSYYQRELYSNRKRFNLIREKFFRIEENIQKVFKEYNTERKSRYQLTDGFTELNR